MPEKAERLDVAQLAGRELTKGDFPAAGKDAFRVYFDRKIHDRIAAHAAEKLSLEICGVLVGDWRCDDNGPFVLIDEAIRADKAVSNAGDVKLTHEDWTEINRVMDTKFTERKIVGWYHSHPNFGIFLSDRDRFVQEFTFNSPGQIAYVVDPVNGVEGVFCWRHGDSKLLPHFWVGDAIHLSSKDKERNPSSASAAESSAPPPQRQEPLPPASSMLTMLLAALCMLLLGYLVGGMRTGGDRIETELGAIARFGLLKGLKYGMHDDLAKLQASVLSIEEAVAQRSSDAADDKKKQWQEVRMALLNTAHNVAVLDAIYSPSPEEAARIQQFINEQEAEKEGVAKPSGQEAKASGSATAKASAAPSAPKASAAPASAKPAGESPAPPKTTAAPSKSTAAPPAAH